MTTRRRARVLFVGGVLLLLASAAHALGWSQFDGRLDQVDAETRAALHAGWLWGSLTFGALGATTALAARRWPRGVDPRPAALPAAAALLVFGAVGFVARGFDPHYLGFVSLSLLVGLPVVGVETPGTLGSRAGA